MTHAWPTATISSFEQVPAVSTVALLRVAAVAQADDVDAGEPRPALVTDDGVTVTRFAAIPAPPDAGRTIRAAYAVADDLIAESTRFWLECGDGSVLALPAPVPGAHRIARAAAQAPVDVEDDDRRSSLGPKLAELTEELAAARHEAALLHEDARSAEATRAELTVLRREGAEMRAELLALGDLARIAAAADASAAREAAALRDRAAGLQELLDEAQRGREAAETERDAAQGEHDVLQAAREDAEGERDVAVASQREAEESVEPLLAANRRAETDLGELRDQVRMMSLEREELIRQAKAFDGVAVKARERASQADSEHRKASARINELEIWSGELERRLGETTTLLAEARATAEHDGAELRRLRGELAEAEAHIELARAEIVSLSGPSDGSKRLEQIGRKADLQAESDPGDASPDKRP